MTLPALKKTWQFDVNKYVYSFEYQYLTIKNSLKGFASNPWTVWGSSNSVSYSSGGGIDYWNAPSDIVAGSGNHSWIVLNSPAGIQLCIDFNYTYSGDKYVSIIWSTGGLFTGGALNARPTATDQYVEISSSSSAIGSSYPLIFQIMHSTDGYNTRIACYNSNEMVFFLMCELPYEQIPGWNNCVFIWLKFGPDSSSKLEYLYTMSYLHTKIGLTDLTLYCTAEGYRDSSVARMMISPDDNTGEWIMSPIGLASITSPHRGRKGSLCDIWWGSTALVDGTTYPNDASRQFIQMGKMIFPWNGSILLKA